MLKVYASAAHAPHGKCDTTKLQEHFVISITQSKRVMIRSYYAATPYVFE